MGRGRRIELGQARPLLGRLNRVLDFRDPPRGYALPSHVWFGSVYRASNAPVVQSLVGDAKTCGWDIRLWALDAVAPGLSHDTVGSGAGGKFQLLQRMLSEEPPCAGAWIVLSDDDYVVRRGTLRDLVALARAARFDLAQPAHRRFVNASHHITLVRPRVIARRTHFVEIGPVFVISPSGRGVILPFPETHMGWGLEYLWGQASLAGDLRLGIVDAVTIEHLHPVAASYDLECARKEMEAFRLEARGAELEDLMVTTGHWRRMRRTPRWA